MNARKIQGEDDDNAESLLRQAIDTAPEYTPALSALADLLLNEDVDEARELSLRCLAVDERDSVCHRTLISSYTRDGLFEDAFPHVAYCLEVDPKNIDCLSSMSSLYLNQGQLDETKRMLTWMRRVDPDSMFTQLAEGGYAHAVGDRDAARDAFDHACNKGQPFACKMLKEL
ncbi:MAG: hypothetical protein GY854_18040 [Deltaproteobacteria bacterium]|nr:hypothetical protein [Deltaproteobacteria bacterium]